MVYIKRLVLVIAILIPLFFITGSKPVNAATIYYGSICIKANAKYLAPNNVYYLLAATDPYCNTASRIKVYRSGVELYNFRSSYDFDYTNPSVPCAWFCDDAGSIINPDGYYIIHCLAYHRGYFSMYSVKSRRWAVLYRLPTGILAPAFISVYDPTVRYIPNGLFYGGWCGA